MLSVLDTYYAVKHWSCKVILSILRSVLLYYKEITKHILPFSVKNPSEPDTIKWYLPSQVGKVVFGTPTKLVVGISLNIFFHMFPRRPSHKVEFWSSNRLVLLVVWYLYQIRFCFIYSYYGCHSIFLNGESVFFLF
jgi:hypothetical protein